MIDENLLRRVLIKAAAVQSPATQEQKTPAGDTPATHAVETRRYYFYEARPENSIKFTALQSILKTESPEKQALIKKLSGGNSGKFLADYFAWKKIAVVTNKYAPGGKSLVSYTADLSPIGSKIAGSEKVTPDDANITAQQIESDLLLFDDTRGNSDVVKLDTSGESYYTNAPVPQNLGQLLSNGGVPAGVLEKADRFQQKFDEYRIWVPNLNQLVQPDMKDPQHDEVQGRRYKGGKDAFDALIQVAGGPAAVSKDTAPMAPPPKTPVEPGKSRFEPVPKSTGAVRGDVIGPGPGGEKTAGNKKKKAPKGDYASVPYSGGTDVVQRLVHDQHEQMNIRKMARKIVLSQMTSTIVNPATQATGKGDYEIDIKQMDPKNPSQSGNVALLDRKEKMEDIKAADKMKKLQDAVAKAVKKNPDQAKMINEMYESVTKLSFETTKQPMDTGPEIKEIQNMIEEIKKIRERSDSFARQKIKRIPGGRNVVQRLQRLNKEPATGLSHPVPSLNKLVAPKVKL